jgi:hypothetical protein
MDDTTHTRDLARRYLKARIRLIICQAQEANHGIGDLVWAPLAWLATGVEQEARGIWQDHARGKTRASLMPYIMQALVDAAQEAPLPYRDLIPQEWLDKKVQDFLDTFDPDTMLVPKGTA